jgi:hypothetical protein
MSDFIPILAGSGGPEIFGEEYNTKVLTTDRANLIGYWPMWEPSGGTAFDLSPEGNDGAYTGVTLGQAGIGDGRTCPLFDGANDFNNIYSAPLNTDFDNGEGTANIWLKPIDANVWDDVLRRIFYISADAENRIYAQATGAGTVNIAYEAGDVTENITFSPSGAEWRMWTITWSTSADGGNGEVKVYRDGVQEGATQAIGGTWVGSLASNNTIIGATSTTPANVWDGYLAHTALWKTPLTAPQIASLAVV